MGITRAVLVCVMLYNAVNKADASVRDLASRQDVNPIIDGRPRVSHRVQLLFPLLLRISTRLGTLVPTAMMGLVGIFLFVAFSKKAFIVSLLALFLTFLDKNRRDEGNALHVQKINVYDDEEEVIAHEEHLHYGLPQRKRLVRRGHGPRWKTFYRFPHRFTYPGEFHGLRRKDEYELLFTGGNSLRYF